MTTQTVKLLTMVAVFFLTLPVANAQSESFADGEVRVMAGGELEAWDSPNTEWVDLERFWVRYADRSGGLTWGRRVEFPPYAHVRELDTMIIELESGPCLMEFFHTRWRRANDVRRWDNAFNEFGGCPLVFD